MGQRSRLLANVSSVNDFTSCVCLGLGHAFFNDRSPQTYDEASATGAWERTLEMPTKAS
jgi:dienelactone hydrolase